MWKGAISFGMVMIPVRVYAATEQRDVAFRQVHRADGGRIRFRRVCEVCGQEVSFSDVAKGYELPDGEMAVLTDDDLAQLPLSTTRSIEVVHFTPAGQLDPVLYGRSYYTEPDPAGLRAYALLRDALGRSGEVAIARVALRQRESLAALRPRDGVLVLTTLLWPDEIREPDFGFLSQEVEVRSQELTMASSLIDSMTVDFDPSQYRDGYREAVEDLVAAKVAGHEVAHPRPPRGEGEGVVSLADALRASLAAARQDGADGRRKGRAGGKAGSAEGGRARAKSGRSTGAGGRAAGTGGKSGGSTGAGGRAAGTGRRGGPSTGAPAAAGGRTTGSGAVPERPAGTPDGDGKKGRPQRRASA